MIHVSRLTPLSARLIARQLLEIDPCDPRDHMLFPVSVFNEAPQCTVFYIGYKLQMNASGCCLLPVNSVGSRYVLQELRG